MLHLPIGHGHNVNPKLFRQTSRNALKMGITAEYLAAKYGISRREQDEFALSSHQRAHVAHRNGEFRRELIPRWGRDRDGRSILVDRDQCVRETTNLEALSALSPAFLPEDGTVTAGNSSPINDGAAALLMMSDQRARQLGFKPLVRVRSTAVVGVEPCRMGIGPVPATQKALARAGLHWNDLQLIELNEAFAAQAIACLCEWDADLERVNVRGGAIALGHPLGASGARLATTLIHAMVERDVQFGLATMCIGLGQGIATIFERVNDG
jgi:acetyl-CoA acyltransferase